MVVGFDTTATNPIQSQIKGLTTNGVISTPGRMALGLGPLSRMRINLGRVSASRILSIPKHRYAAVWLISGRPSRSHCFSPIGYTQSTPYVASNDNNATPAGSLTSPFPGGILAPAA